MKPNTSAAIRLLVGTVSIILAILFVNLATDVGFSNLLLHNLYNWLTIVCLILGASQIIVAVVALDRIIP